jgi:DNA-binding LacI/PurR family transcriptional regulator
MRLKNKDIAERLGISATAVSLALNGKPGVSDETRRRVLEVVSEDASRAYHELGEPPAAAGTVILSVHKSNGKVINDLPFFSNLIESVQQEAMREGYQVTLAHYVAGQDLDAYIDYLSGLGARALLLEATELTHEDLAAYKSLGIPMVLMDGFFDLEDVDAVTLDDMTAVYRAFEHAWDMGHRRIGFLAGDAEIQNFAHHRDGFAKGIREHGADPASCPVVTVGCTAEESYRDVKALLADKRKPLAGPTCWIAQLDYIAIGALRALEEAGLRVPDDVSLIGYGDIGLAEMVDPPLTTTRINRADCGRLAMRTLAQRIADPDAPHTVTTVGSQLVERRSVRRLTPRD